MFAILPCIHLENYTEKLSKLNIDMQSILMEPMIPM